MMNILNKKFDLNSAIYVGVDTEISTRWLDY